MNSFSVIDVSLLVGEDAWLASNKPDLSHKTDIVDVENLICKLEPAGVLMERILMTPFPSFHGNDFQEANERVVQIACTPELRVPAQVVAAARPGDRQSVEVLERMLMEGAPIIGIKLWPYMGGYDLDALTNDIYLCDIIRDNSLIVFLHVGTGREEDHRPAFHRVKATAEVGVKLARRHPDIRFVLAHVARLSVTALTECAHLSNVWIDTSGLTSLGRWREGGRDGLLSNDAGRFKSISAKEILHLLIDEFGLGNRLVFGSIWPFSSWWGIEPLDDIMFLCAAGLTQTQLEKILHLNARNLLAVADGVQVNG